MFTLSTRSGRIVTIATLLLSLTLLSFSPAAAGGHGHGEVHPVKKAILLVAFGTSVPEAKVALDNINEEVRKAFPKTEIRWSYTSKIIRNKLLRDENIDIDSPAEALAKLGEEGYTHVAVQSLHTIPGEEYHNLVRTTAGFQHMPKVTSRVTLGAPLLATPRDMTTVTRKLLKIIPAARKANEAVVFMGHGTHHPGNIYYPGLQYYFAEHDPNIFVGTVEGTPSLEDVIAKLKANNINTVWLMPFMSVAGDHARNDMTGAEDDSWKSILESKGYTVKTVLKGTAEYDSIVAVWVDHLKEAFSHL